MKKDNTILTSNNNNNSNNNILIKNIYYMLSYAFTALNQDNYKNIALETFDNLYNLLAAILVSGIGKQLKQGLYREYRNCKEDIPVMHGKIDLPKTIQNFAAKKRVLTCEYDELSENNLLNQILKTTMLFLLHYSNIDKKYKTALKKEILFFSNIDTISPKIIPWSSLRFQKNTSSYQMLIGLCQLILKGLLFTTENGEYKLASFLDTQQMSHLYEKFILEYYKKEYPKLTVRAAQIPWALDNNSSTMLPLMQSDITLSQGNKVLIIDAKYYAHTMQTRYNAHTIHSNHLYQIFTYVKNKNAMFGDTQHTVSGMLLYARTDETIQPDQVYQMSGNQISVKTLNLNCNFTEITQQLNSIVAKHF